MYHFGSGKKLWNIMNLEKHGCKKSHVTIIKTDQKEKK